MSPDECPTPGMTPTVGSVTTGLIGRWKQIFTGRDNQTLDLGRISWGCSFLAVIGHESYALYKGTGSTLRDFAIALAAVAAAHGVALGVKSKTEPDEAAS